MEKGEAMVTYTCDGCGATLPARGLRYTVKIETRAVYESRVIHLLDLVQDHRKEMERLIARLDREESEKLEAQIYKELALDLCPACHESYLKNPLAFRAAPSSSERFDVESFLRSLGESDPKDE